MERKILLCLAFAAISLIVYAMLNGIRLRNDLAIFVMIASGILLGYGIDYSLRTRSLVSKKEKSWEEEPSDNPRQAGADYTDESEDEPPLDIGKVIDHISQMEKEPVSEDYTNTMKMPDEIDVEYVFKNIDKEI